MSLKQSDGYWYRSGGFLWFKDGSIPETEVLETAKKHANMERIILASLFVTFAYLQLSLHNKAWLMFKSNFCTSKISRHLDNFDVWDGGTQKTLVTNARKDSPLHENPELQISTLQCT